METMEVQYPKFPPVIVLVPCIESFLFLSLNNLSTSPQGRLGRADAAWILGFYLHHNVEGHFAPGRLGAFLPWAEHLHMFCLDFLWFFNPKGVKNGNTCKQYVEI